MRATLICAAIGLAIIPACKESQAPSTPPPELTVSDLWLDAANAPRGDYPLISGEPILFGFRIRGGSPPYAVSINSINHINPNDVAPIPPLEAILELEPSSEQANGIEIGTKGVINPISKTGDYKIRVDVTDSLGLKSQATSEEFSVIGEKRKAADLIPTNKPRIPSLKTSATAPQIAVRDAAGKSRATYFPGERIVLSLNSSTQILKPITFFVRSESSDLVVRQHLLDIGAGISVPIDIPRLTPSGELEISAYVEKKQGTERLATTIIIIDAKDIRPIANPEEIKISLLELFGGPELRTPRGARLKRGEVTRFEIWVRGKKTPLKSMIRLIDSKAQERATADLEEIVWGPTGLRAISSGEMPIPKDVPSGKYKIEVQVASRRSVSSLFREVIIE